MLKHSKKAVAVILALAMMVSSAACSSDKSWAMKNDSLTAPIGTYIYYLYSAYQSAETAAPDKTKPVLEQKIDGKAADTYIKDKALNYTKMLFVLNDKMKELGITLTADETKAISSNTDAQWQQVSSTLEKYGVSKSSFNMAYSDYYTKYQKIFATLYGKNGKKAVSDADLKSYFEKNYTDFSFIIKPLFNSDTNGGAAPLTDAEKAAVKKEFDGYAADITAGKKTMRQAADAFKASSKQTTDPLQSTTEILNSSSGYPSEFVTLLNSMKAGQVKAAEISGYYMLVMKNDISKKSAEQFSTENGRNSVLAQMKGVEYADEMDKAAAAYSNVTLNQKAIDSYQPSMFVTPTSSAPAAPAESAASGK